jgi:hypothetical protein
VCCYLATHESNEIARRERKRETEREREREREKKLSENVPIFYLGRIFDFLYLTP